MLQLGECAKDNSKMFLLNRKVSKLSFGNVKFDWKFVGQPYKSQLIFLHQYHIKKYFVSELEHQIQCLSVQIESSSNSCSAGSTSSSTSCGTSSNTSSSTSSSSLQETSSGWYLKIITKV